MLSPVEAVLLARHSASLAGRVLELGCGAGRLTRVLAGLSGAVHALDVSPRMVAECQRRVPAASVVVGDLRDLSGVADGSTGAIVALANVVDVLGHAERLRALAEFRRILVPDGVLLFSTHNRAHLEFMHLSPRVLNPEALRSPRTLASAAWNARLIGRRLRNRRHARRYERSEAEYAIVNEPVHEHRLAHYYLGRDVQERQLGSARFAVVDCLDEDGVPVPPGQDAASSAALHYAVRPLA